MRCRYCQGENPDGSKFCLHCGGPISVYCTRCKASLPSEARFCNVCGRAIDSLGSGVPSQPLGEQYTAALERGEKLSLVHLIEDFEAHLIDAALRIAKGNKHNAADLLGIKRTTFLAKLKLRHNQDQD